MRRRLCKARLWLQQCKDTEDNAQRIVIQTCIGPITYGIYRTVHSSGRICRVEFVCSVQTGVCRVTRLRPITRSPSLLPVFEDAQNTVRNMELSETRKNDNFGKSSKFPGIMAGNSRDRRFLGIPISREFPYPGWEFPVALFDYCGIWSTTSF